MGIWESAPFVNKDGNFNAEKPKTASSSNDFNTTLHQNTHIGNTSTGLSSPPPGIGVPVDCNCRLQKSAILSNPINNTFSKSISILDTKSKHAPATKSLE